MHQGFTPNDFFLLISGHDILPKHVRYFAQIYLIHREEPSGRLVLDGESVVEQTDHMGEGYGWVWLRKVPFLVLDSEPGMLKSAQQSKIRFILDNHVEKYSRSTKISQLHLNRTAMKKAKSPRSGWKPHPMSATLNRFKELIYTDPSDLLYLAANRLSSGHIHVEALLLSVRQ